MMNLKKNDVIHFEYDIIFNIETYRLRIYFILVFFFAILLNLNLSKKLKSYFDILISF